MDRTKVFATGVLALGFALALSCGTASAASHVDVGVGIGVAPSYSEGHYETRIERVLVSPEHYERRWVDAVVETRYIRGRPQRVEIHSGYYTDVFVPARFEERRVSVWVPCSRPVITGGFLGFNFGSHHR